jgi:hypothetical protein
MIYMLGSVAVLRWLWERPSRAPRIVAAVVVVAAFYTTRGYVRHAWHMFPLWPDYTNRIEYKITDWLWKNMPDARAYPTGSVRFWFDTWHDLAQLGGGSEQGLLNQQVEPAQWETNLGLKPEPSILWLQCMGVDAAYVSDQRSQEEFKDFQYPLKFSGRLPVLYDDQAGSVIYKIPRRYPVRARVVERARLNALKPPRFNDDVEYLGAYADVIEKGPDSMPSLLRNGTDAMTVSARLAAGQSLVVQESYDPAWHASAGGQALPVRKDAIGFMVIDAPPGERQIELVFRTPLENQVGRVLTAGTLLLLVFLASRKDRMV